MSPRISTILASVMVVALGWMSVGDAIFSPYNRIEIQPGGNDIVISVNRDFHQTIHDLSNEALDTLAGTPEGQRIEMLRAIYNLPFVLTPPEQRGRVLVVGAGTGNDVQAGVRSGFDEVISVDIDQFLIDLGRRLHPEQPYSSPVVQPVVNDARAFFEQYQGPPFDVVCYGLLDSHAMFGALSTLRLDNYVYTREGIRAAWQHVNPDGYLAISFSIYAGDWIRDRLYWTIAEATGREPTIVNHGMNYGATFFVAQNPAPLLKRFETLPFEQPTPSAREAVVVTTDDWPFLYLKPEATPWGYLAVLSCVLLLSAASVRVCFGREAFGRRFDGTLFLMGAGFLLLETRGITVLSLTFGSTWMVNSAIFGAVLLLVLIGNALVSWLNLENTTPWFVGLLVTTALLGLFNVSSLGAYPLLVRGALGSLVLALPVFFAGVIVPILLRRTATPAMALGSNLIGSVVGGCLEYLSMLIGLQALAFLALALYAGAAILHSRAR